MGQLTFQATLGGAINLSGPNIATTTTFTLPSADGTNGQALTTNGTGTLAFATISGTPGGSTTQVQYNNAGAFAGSANMTFNGTKLTLANDASINGVTVGQGSGGATNTAVGVNALLGPNTNANQSLTAIGNNALYKSTNSFYTTAVGTQAMFNTTATTYAVAVGSYALYSQTTGTNNCAIGNSAMYGLLTGQDNVGVGNSVLNANQSGSYNVCVGNLALVSSTTASYNTAIGHQASYGGTLAQNVSVGYQALYTGGNNDNVAIGYQALYTEGNTGNGQNVAIGSGASKVSLSSAYNNVCIGYRAAFAQTSGSGNTIIGATAGTNLTSATSVTIVGTSAGAGLTTGAGGTYIGGSATASSGTASSEIVLCVGNGPTGKGSNTAFINANGGSTFNGANTTTFATTSDQRLKKNIVDNNVGLEKINAIRVRNFEYRVEEEVTELPAHSVISKQGVQLGVIAQELQTVLPDCVKEESTGVLCVDSDNLTWYMINAIKELKAEFDAYKASHP
jgi:hypothetical protein